MAIFHMSVKTVSRSSGRSATAAAAYRSAAKIVDKQTGEIHNYTRKTGVIQTKIITPTDAPDWANNREKLWNAAEDAEKRKNSTVAREFEIALPEELPWEARAKLAYDFAQAIVIRHKCVADVAIHQPNTKGDNRNHHAHILLTTRRMTPTGLGEKTRELDSKQTGSELVKQWREYYANLQNERLAEYGIKQKVDHRTLKEQGIERLPTTHLGVTAVAIERRTGEPSRRRLDYEKEVLERLQKAKELGELEREQEAINQSIISLSTDIKAAYKEKLRKGVDEFNQKKAADKKMKQEQTPTKRPNVFITRIQTEPKGAEETTKELTQEIELSF